MKCMDKFNRKAESATILTFKLGESNFAIPIDYVVRVEQAAAITKIPNLPQHILGLLNHHGTLIPVVDIRSALTFESSPLRPENQFIILNRKSQNLAIVTDKIIGLTSPTTNVETNSLFKFPLKISEVITVEGDQVLLLITPEHLLDSIDLSDLSEQIKNFQNRMTQSSAPFTDNQLEEDR